MRCIHKVHRMSYDHFSKNVFRNLRNVYNLLKFSYESLLLQFYDFPGQRSIKSIVFDNQLSVDD